MVCMAADRAMSVNGGNRRLFDRMLRHNKNEVLLNTHVTDISLSSEPGYHLVMSTSSMGNGHGRSASIKARVFDAIILAAPLQYANITFKPPLASPPPPVPYVTLYVTIFISPYRLSPRRFGLADSEQVPTTILTTLPADAGPPPNHSSLSTLRTVINPHTLPARKEYLYKLFSPAPPSIDDLLGLLDQRNTSPTNDSVITWQYDKKWHAYPYLPPRVSYDNPQLDELGALWYTSGIEPFISTMETSSLMGKNVAQLIVDRWLTDIRR